MEVGLIMQNVTIKDFYSVKINDKACSIFIHQSRIYPQIPIFLSGFLTLQITLNTSERKNPTHLHYKNLTLWKKSRIQVKSCLPETKNSPHPSLQLWENGARTTWGAPGHSRDWSSVGQENPESWTRHFAGSPQLLLSRTKTWSHFLRLCRIPAKTSSTSETELCACASVPYTKNGWGKHTARCSYWNKDLPPAVRSDVHSYPAMKLPPPPLLLRDRGKGLYLTMHHRITCRKHYSKVTWKMH